MLKRIDYKLLFELDDNARQSYGDIAKKIGTSKQVVGNHLNMLVREKYIRKFLTILDLSKVGLILHKVYVRLIRASSEDEIMILSFLEKHENVAWLVRTEGIYDLAFALHTKDIVELNKIMLDIENKFGHFFSEKIINRVVTGEFFHRDYLIENKKSDFRKNIIFQSYEPLRDLDAIDWKILGRLTKDTRISSIDIAKNTTISADAVGKRIKNLEKTGIIKNHILVLNDEKLGQLHYKILLKVGNFNLEVERKFLEFCRQNPYITFYNKCIGAWDLELDLEVKNPEDFRGIMRLIKQEFAASVKEYFSLMIYDILKFDFLPMSK